MEDCFYSQGRYLKDTFGERVHKISAKLAEKSEDNGDIMLCTGGIIPPHSFDGFATLKEQISSAKERIRQRYKSGKYLISLHTGPGIRISLDSISKATDEIIQDPEVIGITLTTVPDCLSDPLINFLHHLSGYIYTGLELGLHTTHDETLRALGLTHTNAQAKNAIIKLMGTRLMLAPHLVLGLPGETAEIMHETMRDISMLNLTGINIEQFVIYRGSPFEEKWRAGGLKILSCEEYVGMACDFIEMLKPEVVLHRILTEISREDLLEPEWSIRKKDTLTMISEEMKKRNSCQGFRFTGTCAAFGIPENG